MLANISPVASQMLVALLPTYAGIRPPLRPEGHRVVEVGTIRNELLTEVFHTISVLWNPSHSIQSFMGVRRHGSKKTQWEDIGVRSQGF